MDLFYRPSEWMSSLLRSLFNINKHKLVDLEIDWEEKSESTRISANQSQQMALGRNAVREHLLLQGDEMIHDMLSEMDTSVASTTQDLRQRREWIEGIEQIKKMQKCLDPNYESGERMSYSGAGARYQRAGVASQTQANRYDTTKSQILGGADNAAPFDRRNGGTSETPRDFFRRLAAESEKRREDERGVFKQFAASEKQLDPLAKEILTNLDRVDTTSTSSMYYI